MLTESRLRRTCGDADVLREQIDYSIKLSKRSDIMLRVMPFDQPAGQRSWFKSPFTLIHVPFPGAAGPLELVYVEGEGEIRYLDDKKALDAHEVARIRVSNAALRFEEARKFVKSVLQDIRSECLRRPLMVSAAARSGHAPSPGWERAASQVWTASE